MEQNENIILAETESVATEQEISMSAAELDQVTVQDVVPESKQETSQPTELVDKSISTTHTVSPKKRNIIIAICAAVAVIAAVFALLFIQNRRNDLQFLGIEKGYSAEEVIRILGEPSDLQDYGSGHFRYTYNDIELLGKKGYFLITFLSEEVASCRFMYIEYTDIKSLHTQINTTVLNYYDDVVEFFTNRYGEPIGSGSSRTSWVFEKGANIQVEYVTDDQLSDDFYSANVTIEITFEDDNYGKNVFYE